MAVANSLKFSRGIEPSWSNGANPEQAVANVTFDCALHFETQLPSGELCSEYYLPSRSWPKAETTEYSERLSVPSPPFLLHLSALSIYFLHYKNYSTLTFIMINLFYVTKFAF